MGGTSRALGNLRALTILLVVSFHSVLAYLGSQPDVQPAFDAPPFSWRAVPIIDHERWFGFDIYCAFQYVFLMPLMFFLSGLFVWRSISRKGVRIFLYDRLLRIGVPFVLASALLMPLAHYPVYRVTASDPSWSAFWANWLALPLWPAGPLWFLWQLLLLDLSAAAMFRFAPGLGERLGGISGNLGSSPLRYFLGFLAVSTLAYLPPAVFFKPWEWSQFGPFSVMTGRILQFAVYFFAGLGLGANGIEQGLLESDGKLARQWRYWAGLAVAAFFAWLGVTALAMNSQPPSFLIDRVTDILFALSSASACFAFLAVFLHFASRPVAVARSLAENAYAIYLVHYFFVIWLQYFLLGVSIFALAKGITVFTGALALSWATALGLRRLPFIGRLIFSERSAGAVSTRPVAAQIAMTAGIAGSAVAQSSSDERRA
ncbi:MAG TPA: acyltransferase [Hyphomicrobiales bacterium]|nr:acyltransferase [Hyphomicrobiales bacterium]